jgi:hypothetical protein
MTDIPWTNRSLLSWALAQMANGWIGGAGGEGEQRTGNGACWGANDWGGFRIGMLHSAKLGSDF